MGEWTKQPGGELEIGEMTRGRSDSGRKGKWTKRLGGERESGRNDPDSVQAYLVITMQKMAPGPYSEGVWEWMRTHTL